MIFDQQFLTFMIAATILTITPGNDTFLVFNRTLGSGRRCGVYATAGVLTGLPVHGIFASVGLSVILVQSAELFMVVKYVGAAYLAYLGLKGIWDAWRRNANGSGLAEQAMNEEIPSMRRCFVEGFLSNVLNPKVAIFYLSFLPQFISPGDPVMLKSITLAGFHWLTGVFWLFFVVLAVGKARVVLRQPRIRRWLESVSGAVLILFGLKLALEKR